MTIDLDRLEGKETRKKLSELVEQGFVPLADDGFGSASIMQRDDEHYFYVGELNGEPVYRQQLRQGQT